MRIQFEDMSTTSPQSDPDRSDTNENQNFSGAPDSSRTQKLLLVGLRATFLILVISTVSLTLAAARSNRMGSIPTPAIVGSLLAAFGSASLVLIADVLTPKKHLASVLGIYIGVSVGLVAALGFAALVDTVANAWELTDQDALVYLGLTKGVAGICLVYLSVSVVLSTKDDFRLVIPYIQFEKRAQGVMPLLMDTSAIIDGRMIDLARTGVIDAPIVIQNYVINELQALADSKDRSKRERGRHGLDRLSRLQEAYFDTRIEDSPTTETLVDRKLIQTAQQENYRIVTTDSGLAKVARIQKIPVLNVNDVSGSLRQTVLPGVRIPVEIIKPGESPDQDIAYMPDGTMLVVEQAGNLIGQNIEVEITNTLQRAGSRLVFARPANHEASESTETSEKSEASSLGRSATSQDPVRERPRKRDEDGPRLPRNPRRGK